MNEKTGYQRKLANPLWQKKRLEILTRDNWTCKSCYGKDSELHVHHVYYQSNLEPHEYPNEAYVTLCYQCHEIEEQQLKDNAHDLIKILRKAGFDSEAIKNMSKFFIEQPTSLDLACKYTNCLYFIRDIMDVDPKIIFELFERSKEANKRKEENG